MNKVLPFMCSKCGGPFDVMRGGLCSVCHRPFCLVHLNTLTKGKDSVFFCGECGKEHEGEKDYLNYGSF